MRTMLDLAELMNFDWNREMIRFSLVFAIIVSMKVQASAQCSHVEMAGKERKRQTYQHSDQSPRTHTRVVVSSHSTEFASIKSHPSCGQQDRRTAPAIVQPPVDFNNPPRQYQMFECHGWVVYCERELIEEDSAAADQAVERLTEKLEVVAQVLPERYLADLRELKLFLMFGTEAANGGRNSGLEYFSADSSQHRSWLDPRMDSSIVIYSAHNYIQLSDLWAVKSLVHEFGHAHHLENWPEIQPEIFDTWKHAIESGLYQEVIEQDRQAHVPNYAAQNHLEYFAELTAMYFVRANYFPYDRDGLREYDPAGFALMQKFWQE